MRSLFCIAAPLIYTYARLVVLCLRMHHTRDCLSPNNSTIPSSDAVAGCVQNMATEFNFVFISLKIVKPLSFTSKIKCYCVSASTLVANGIDFSFLFSPPRLRLRRLYVDHLMGWEIESCRLSRIFFAGDVR